MLKALSTRIATHATFTRIILFALLYACCLGTIAYLTLLIAGSGTFRVIELEPSWQPQEVHAHFSSLDAEAVSYTKYIILIDILNIIAYTMMFSSLIAWLYKKSIPADHPRMKLCLVPVIMALLDILENTFMYAMLNDGNINTATILNITILAKLAAGGLCAIILISAIPGALRNKR